MLSSFPVKEGYSYAYPNFDSVDAWPMLILLHGPPSYYCTSWWECLHKHMRQLKQGGNGKNIEKTMLKHNSLCVSNLYTNDNDSVSLEIPVQSKQDMELIGKCKQISKLSKSNYQLLQSAIRTLEWQGISFSNEIQEYSGISFHSHYHHTPFYTIISMISVTDIPQLVQVTKLFSHKVENNIHNWIQGTILSISASNNGLAKVKPQTNTKPLLLPIVSPAMFTFMFPVHIVQVGNELFYNSWINK